MPSTYSTRLRLELQADGENDTTWGQKLNSVISLTDEARAGYLSKSVAGSGTVTLTANNGTSDESRQAFIEFTGALTGNVSVVVPTAEFWWFVKNSTTGAFTLTVKTSAGTGIAVTQGKQAFLYCDGTNVLEGPSLSNLMGVVPVTGLSDDAVTLAKMEHGTQGDILYYGASGAPTRLGAGTAGQYLKTNGPAANPTWAAVVSVPTGMVGPYAGATAPTGWLLCGGQAVSRTTYADLFAVIGTQYGAGDGTTTFNVPDVQGRVIAGKDDMSGTSADRLTAEVSGIDGDTLGATGGDQHMQRHDHPITDPGHTHPNSFNSFAPFNVGSNGNGQFGSTGSSTTGITIADAGEGDSENVQPTIVLNYIIKT